MNGAVKIANKNMKKIIRKIIERHRDWHEKLSYALLSYRTAIRTSIGTTPYNLMYGMEAVLPAEVKIPSLRILMEAKLNEADWIKQRHKQLSLKVKCHLSWSVLSKKNDPCLQQEGQIATIRRRRQSVETYFGSARGGQRQVRPKLVLPGGALVLAEMDEQVFP
ncbi:uncharacterized protein [Coffea arabica]|uniref:Uncharacterized protein n=1 Tax=Coffea arabica TaxID=13443 RepID=A0A6P6X3B3_COFAR|nr:uncharacterized protein LOC113739030 [Coffea arabica]